MADNTPRFLEYGSPDSLLFEPLISAPGNGFSAVGTGAGTEDYNKDGVLLGFNVSLRKTDFTTAEKDLLQISGCITIWVETEFLSVDYLASGGSENMFSAFRFNGASFQFSAYKGNGSSTITGRSATSFSGNAQIKQDGKKAYSRVDMSWIGNRATVYVDYFPVIQFDLIFTALQFNEMHIGGRQTGSLINHRMKNFQIGSIPVSIPVHPLLSRFVSLGHSFGSGGNYAGSNQLIIGDGENSLASGDVRANATLHRELHKIGIGIGSNKIASYAAGGVLVAALDAQITAMLADNGVVTCAMIQMGTNDVFVNTALSSFEADMQSGINRLVAAGCTLILIVNVATVAMDGAFLPVELFSGRVDGFNTSIDTIVAANPSVTRKVDDFNLFGRHENFDTDDFGADPLPDIHPSDQGYNRKGMELFRILTENLG